jgi:hypothetical protein
MKHCFNLPKALAATATLLGALSGQAAAQTTLLDWTHTWNYMHPTGGALPAGSGATEPNTGATKWYADETAFAASYAGPSFATSGTGFEAGTGAGPLGYGTADYFTVAGAEFAALGTTLTTPVTGARRTAYFRTTFTVPGDGNFYTNPVIRFILDDGGFIYLDGELVLTVNMAAAVTDTYAAATAGSASTEADIRVAELSLPVGSATGAIPTVTPVIAANSTVMKRLLTLSPGEHTLAISTHNAAVDSSDLTMAVQLSATPTSCAISGTFTNVTRGAGALPQDPADDVVSVTINVTPTGSVSPAGWTITAPASIAGTTGAYNTDVTVNIPIAEFPADPVAAPTTPAAPTTISLADAATLTCVTASSIMPPRIIASDDTTGLNTPISTTGTNPSVGWVFDDVARTLYMNSGGGGARKVVTSGVLDLSSMPAVLFSGSLLASDISSGTEAADSFVAYLIVDGNTAAPVNLISAYDTIIPDGVLTDDELAAAPGDFVKEFNYILPASANSVQIVIEGTNDSPNEFYTVRDMKISAAPPTVRTTAGTVTVNNQGTDDPLDDTFGAPVTIEAVNLGASTGWTSDTTPATGLYTDAQPILFQNFPLSGAPQIINFTDIGNLSATSTITLTPPATTLTVSAPANILRVENGPGIADDTVTFDVMISGANGGPRWTTTAGVTPASGNFGAVTFTVAAPLPASPLVMSIDDISYPTFTQSITIPIPGRYVIGQKDTTGGLTDVLSALTPAAPAEYINDPLLRTLQVTNAGTPEKVLESELIDLSAAGAVQFSAKLHATDSSAGSNFDTPDKLKAELVYEVAGVPTTINLISAWDVGNGDPAITGTGLNGSPDGYINGYNDAAGTDAANGTAYATPLDNYNANRVRDEFNKNGQGGEESLDATFDLAATIPADADNVKLKLYVLSVGAAPPSETVNFSDILFSTTGVPADADSDGMTDAYEDANSLNRNDPSDKFTDLDGDGQSNHSEFLAGTAANDGESTLRITTITATGAPNIYDVAIATVAGKRYQLQESTDLGNADGWANIPGIVIATGATTTVPIDVTGLGGRHFLRARVVP